VTKNSSSSLGSQHVELAKLRHAQVVGDLEGDEACCSKRSTVSSCSRIRSMVSKMTSTSTAARPGKGRLGKTGSVSRSVSALRPWRVPAG
jgi:hypothetical protein